MTTVQQCHRLLGIIWPLCSAHLFYENKVHFIQVLQSNLSVKKSKQIWHWKCQDNCNHTGIRCRSICLILHSWLVISFAESDWKAITWLQHSRQEPHMLLHNLPLFWARVLCSNSTLLQGFNFGSSSQVFFCFIWYQTNWKLTNSSSASIDFLNLQ